MELFNGNSHINGPFSIGSSSCERIHRSRCWRLWISRRVVKKERLERHERRSPPKMRQFLGNNPAEFLQTSGGLKQFHAISCFWIFWGNKTVFQSLLVAVYSVAISSLQGPSLVLWSMSPCVFLSS